MSVLGSNIYELQEIARLKIDLADRIPAEPPTDQANAVHLVIKLPSGGRLERRFLPEHSLKVGYFLIQTNKEITELFFLRMCSTMCSATLIHQTNLRYLKTFPGESCSAREKGKTPLSNRQVLVASKPCLLLTLRLNLSDNRLSYCFYLVVL